jgi:hypothetical protein
MTDPRFLAAASAAGGPIEKVGAAWMLHPEQFEATTAAGYGHPFAGYFAGRGGVLGEVTPEVVDATFAIFAPEVVTMMWNMGLPVHGARGGAELYFRQGAEWAQRHLAGVDGLERFAELGERVIASAPALGLPLFAGWRTLPRVSDPAGHAFQVSLILRELRGAIHVAAVASAGVSALEAHKLAGKPDEYIDMFGWPKPYPDVAHLKGVRDEVEETTNARCAQILAGALSAEEADELGRLAEAMYAAVSAG